MEIHTGKIFQSGGSQAVRLPQECRFPAGVKEVQVIATKEGKIILSQKKRGIRDFYARNLPPVDPDFMKDREDFIVEDKDIF